MPVGFVNTQMQASSLSFDSGTNSLSSFVALTSFTPVLSGSTTPPNSVTYSTQFGRYQRVGSVVMFTFRIALSAFTLGAGAGDILITGFPVTAINLSHSGDCALSIGDINVGVNTVQLALELQPNTTTAKFQISRDALATSYLALSNITATSTMEGTGIYFV